MTDFSTLGLAEPLLRAIRHEGYTTATPIQSEVIPALLAGEDVLGLAQTGTGKTAAFVLPILNRLAEGRRRPAPKTCRALILAPTRELAQQIAASIEAYGRFVKPSVAVVVGGVKPGPQVRALAGGLDILVATPGRLLDHLSTGAASLAGADFVVLDEADQMLDLGFLPAIRKIMGRLPAARQTVLMSATMPPPIRSLAADFQRSPREIAVARVARPIERIRQSVRHVPATGKRDALVGILSGEGVERAIVFTRTKRGADKVARWLDDAGLPSAALHGNKSQAQRERALAAFREGRTAILVATDIAARGIDIDNISHVVNYELPNVPEAYVHRIGRTARAGADGIAISLCDGEERGLLRDIERLIGGPIAAEGTPVPSSGPSVPARGGRPSGGGKPSPSKRGEGGQRRGRSDRSRPDGRPDSRPDRRAPRSAAPSPAPRTDQHPAAAAAAPGPDAPADGLARMLGNIGKRSPATV